jgi:hypothetical protein
MANIVDPVIGTFSSAGLSSTFTPAPNASFSVQLSGNFTGAEFFLTANTGSGQSLWFDNSGYPLRLYHPGGVQIAEVPYTAPGTSVPPSYQLVCKVIGAGVCQYEFSQ